MIKNGYFNVAQKNCFKASWRSHWFYFKPENQPLPLFDAQKSTDAKKTNLKLFIFWSHLFRPTPNTAGQENRNYELRVWFCNSPICSKKTNYWGFILTAGRVNVTSNLDNILRIVVKWKYSSFYRFPPTRKLFCDYFKSRCAFHRIQVIATKKIVLFVFDNNLVQV